MILWVGTFLVCQGPNSNARAGPVGKSSLLSRNHAVALGSAVVPTAVFGVPLKTSVAHEASPMGGGESMIKPAGGTPARATGTVALQKASEWFGLGWGKGRICKLAEMGDVMGGKGGGLSVCCLNRKLKLPRASHEKYFQPDFDVVLGGALWNWKIISRTGAQ
jgi:hypothetical protein